MRKQEKTFYRLCNMIVALFQPVTLAHRHTRDLEFSMNTISKTEETEQNYNISLLSLNELDQAL